MGVLPKPWHCQHLMPCMQAQQVVLHTAGDKAVHSHQTRLLTGVDARCPCLQVLPMPAGAGLDLTSLCITTSKACWHIYVDALVVSTDGNMADAVSIAALVSLLSGQRVGDVQLHATGTLCCACRPGGCSAWCCLPDSMHQGSLGAVMAALAQGKADPSSCTGRQLLETPSWLISGPV